MNNLNYACLLTLDAGDRRKCREAHPSTGKNVLSTERGIVPRIHTVDWRVPSAQTLAATSNPPARRLAPLVPLTDSHSLEKGSPPRSISFNRNVILSRTEDRGSTTAGTELWVGKLSFFARGRVYTVSSCTVVGRARRGVPSALDR